MDVRLDTERIQRYCDYENLYRGRHEMVFNLDGDKQFPNVKMNLVSPIILTMAQLTCSKTPTFSSKNKKTADYVNNRLAEDSFGTKSVQFVQQGFLYGDTVIKISSDAEGNPTLSVICPKIWYPEFDPDDVNSIIAHALGYKRIVDGKGVFRAEIHEPGLILNKFFLIDSGGKVLSQIPHNKISGYVPEWAMLPEIQETGVDEPLIVSWSRDKLCGEKYGSSLYKDIWDELYALDRRATQEDRVLSKHADPKLILDAGAIDRDERGNVILSDLDVILKPSGSDVEMLGYVTWDGKLDAVSSQIDRLTKSIYTSTGISTVFLAGAETQSRAETGLAFIGQILPTIFKVEGTQKELEGPMKDIARKIVKLANANGKKVPMSNLNIDSWGIRLPMDVQSMVNSEVQLVAAGIKTPQEAKADLDKLSKS